jgi:tagaturonate epimerase
MLAPIGLARSFGFGDRLGLATPGHIAAVRGTGFAPVFAQQSVRENGRTGRTPQQVLDDAWRAVEAVGWEEPWGADADHLKSVADLPAFVAAGYTFYTVDPGAEVDEAADTDSLPELREKARGRGPKLWHEFTDIYLDGSAAAAPWGRFSEATLLRAVVKYGRAVDHTVELFRRLAELRQDFDFEVSVDETAAPTTPLEHYFIAHELSRRGVRFTSLAPRFSGRFEKGVDYIGDLAALDAELGQHAAVTRHLGSYKLSLHSGSDKFSVYPLLVRHWGDRLHVKTAGTSYLEALRALALSEPVLFRRVLELGLERYAVDRTSYHVSADPACVPVVTADVELPGLLDDFHAREVLHVTFGSALSRYGVELRRALVQREELYGAQLRRHFERHFTALGRPAAPVVGVQR